MNQVKVKFTAEKTRDMKKVMVTGNRVIAKWHKKVLAKRGITNRGLSRDDFRAELFKVIDAGERQLDGIRLSVADIAKVNEVRKLQNKIVSAFTGLIRQHAWRWSKRTNGYPDFWDYHGEASIALINAVYGYRKRGAKFITYATWAITNRMIGVYNSANSLSPWTLRDRRLYELMEQTRREINGPHNFQDLMDRMDLSPKHRYALERAIKNKVQYASEIREEHSNENDCGDDYTALGQDAKYLRGICDEEEHETLSSAQLAVFETIDLSHFEWEVINAAMIDGERGWQARLIRRYVNPETGKSYTPPAARMALQRIRGKLERAYRSVTGEDWDWQRKIA